MLDSLFLGGKSSPKAHCVEQYTHKHPVALLTASATCLQHVVCYKVGLTVEVSKKNPFVSTIIGTGRQTYTIVRS